MSDMNQSCGAILECVINSGLDFNINQTPYSVQLSLRKKISKISNQTYSSTPSTTSSTLKSAHQDDRLRQELLYTRNEYVRLYNLYMIEYAAKCKIQEEYNSVLEKVNIKETNNKNTKALNAEKKQLKDKYEQKLYNIVKNMRRNRE